ncbi:hypothetical protein [Caldiplasma sukawensis]
MNSFENVIFLLSSAVAVSAFYIQGQEFIIPMIRGQTIQSIIIGIISIILSYVFSNPDFLILGILIILLRGVLISEILVSKIPKNTKYIYEENVNLSYLFLVDLIFITFSSLIVFFVVFDSIKIQNINVGPVYILIFPFLLFFQGLFLIISRNVTYTQIIGYIEEENSLVLFGIFLFSVPLVIELSVFLDIIVLVIISSVVVKEKFKHEKVEELIG